MTRQNLIACLIPLALILSSCGGGSSGSDILITGTLTEGEGTDHEKSLQFKHSAGERIENVQICALGECSTTDGEGQWGFEAGGNFGGGEVAFTINGHGIDAVTVVDIPGTAQEVFVDFQHVDNGLVEAEHVTIDGEVFHNEDSNDDHNHDE